jgi:hypothetical protein
MGFGDLDGTKASQWLPRRHQRDMTALVREEQRWQTTMVDIVGGHNCLQQIGRMLEKQEGARLTEGVGQ